MKEDAFSERLNDYIDESLSAEEVTRTRRHLQTCDDCRRLEAELRAIRDEARELESPEPPEELWTGIAASLLGGRPSTTKPATQALRLYFALAAAIVLAVSIYLLERPGPEDKNPDELVSMVTAELQAAESHYDRAIEGLEQIVAQNDGVLNEELNIVLNANLDLIEQAIDESRQAIGSDPDSTVAQESLLEALRRKVSLLQNTILLINEVRKGEGENALELIDEMRGQTPKNSI